MPDLDRLASDVADAVIHRECEHASKIALAESMFEALGFKRVRRPRRPNWRARDRFLSPHEKRFATMLKGVWAEEKRIILANMKRSPLPKFGHGDNRAIIKDGNIFIDSWLYPKTLMEKELSGKSARLLLQLMTAAANKVIAEYALDVSFALINANARTWLQTYTPKLSANLEQVNYETIRGQLLQGFDAGEGMRDLAARVNSTFDTFDKSRAEMIARTETIRAQEQGNQAVYKEAGFERKVWFANPGCCELCEELDNKDVPIGEPYFDDDYGDGMAPPRHVNCRCTSAPFDSSWAD
jgi:SPP1 gp7 family putative phage head morphogenesis protein